jgi:hypothetical protein
LPFVPCPCPSGSPPAGFAEIDSLGPRRVADFLHGARDDELRLMSEASSWSSSLAAADVDRRAPFGLASDL